MRIAQVVALVARTGAYGGPATVALEQCRGLTELGHEVTLFAGVDADDRGDLRDLDLPPGTRPMPARRIGRSRSFATLHSTTLLRDVRHGAFNEFDIVHVHLGRDLMSMPVAARVPSTRLVVQTHGMIATSRRHAIRAFDLMLTRRVLNRSQAILWLTDHERADLRTIAGHGANLVPIRNGVRVLDTPARQPGDPKRIVFCARLHPRKRVISFLEMAELIAPRWPDAQFIVAGPDEGDLEVVETFLASSPVSRQVDYVGGLSGAETRDLLADADLYVLPSFQEPFPMTVLEALACGTPVVMTSQSGLAPLLAPLGAAAVTSGSAQELADAVEQLLTDDDRWRRASTAGRDVIRATFSRASLAESLQDIYESVRSTRTPLRLVDDRQS